MKARRNGEGRRNRFAISLLAFFSAAGLTGCGGEVEDHHYMIARRVDAMQGFSLTVTLVRRFEKENWCEAEKESLAKREFETECRYGEPAYKPMFQGEAAGKWYVLQRMGRFSPTVVIYEFNPPIPDGVILAYLKKSAPHILQFAAIHKAPAEVRIFSPLGEVS